MKRNIRYATVFLLYMLGILTGMLLGSCGSTSELRTLRNYYYSTEKFFDDMDQARAKAIEVKEQSVTKIALKYRGKKTHKSFSDFYKAIFTLQQSDDFCYFCGTI